MKVRAYKSLEIIDAIPQLGIDPKTITFIDKL